MKSLAVATFVCLIFACTSNGEDTSSEKPIWFTVEQQSTGFEIQFVDGEKFKLIDTIAGALQVDDDKVKLAPSAELPLAFDSDKFLVIKIDDKRVTLAPGSNMPLDVTRSVASNLEREGYEGAVIRSPDELLQHIKPKDPFGGDPADFRRYAFRDRLSFGK